MKLFVILFLYVFLLLQVDMKYILTDFMFRKIKKRFWKLKTILKVFLYLFYKNLMSKWKISSSKNFPFSPNPPLLDKTFHSHLYRKNYRVTLSPFKDGVIKLCY